VFDTLNRCRYPPLLTAGEDVDTVNPYGVNRFSGANISTIAIEVPITRITSDGKVAATTANPVIGMYGSTARQRVRKFDDKWAAPTRMAVHPGIADGNPLVNELIINTPSKDKWNATEPRTRRNSRVSTRIRCSRPRSARLRRAHRTARRVARVRPDGLMGILLIPAGARRLGLRSRALICWTDRGSAPTAPESQKRLGAALSSDPAGGRTVGVQR
jgi:hypothetical protein